MESFHMLLFRAFHRQRQFLRPYMSEMGLSPGQARVLGYLEEQGPCRQRALAEHSEVDPATICRMLDTMEKSGLIRRQADRQDRRAGLVSITDKGREANRQWRQRCREMEQAVVQGFSPEEREQFARFLYQAYRNLGGKLE